MKYYCILLLTSFLCSATSSQLLAQQLTGNCSPSGDACPFFTINLTGTIDSCNSCNGTVSVNITGGTSPFTYLWSPSNQTTTTATGLCSGTYSIQVTDGNSNTCSCSISVTSPPPLIVSCSANPDTIIYGNSTQLNSIPSGGISPYVYQWMPASALNSPIISNPVSTPISSVCYTVTVTDSYGCINSCQICVVVDSAVGISQYPINIEIIFYPNPITNHFTIETEENKNFIVRITNPLGQKVAEKKFQKKIEIDVSTFGKGLFLVEVCTAEGKVCHTKKVLIE